MIIFGTRGVTYNHEQGQFHCPSCGPQSFRHKRVRRFFTLYFIPVIPLDLLGEYVECGACRGTYKPEVLQFDPGAGQAAFEAEFHHAMRDVMMLMMLADGHIDDSEVETIQAIYRQLADRELLATTVRNDADRLQGKSVHSVLEPLAGTLNESGKELVIKAAIMVAFADGEFAEEEKQLLGDIAGAIQMTPAHFKGVLASMAEA